MIKLSACAAHRNANLVSTPREAVELVAELRRLAPGVNMVPAHMHRGRADAICCPAVGYAREIVSAAYRAGDLYE